MSVSSNRAKFTRRKLAAALAPAVLGSVMPAQQRASSAADSTSDPAEELRRERIRNNAGVLAKVKLPMATEPAFQFKA